MATAISPPGSPSAPFAAAVGSTSQQHNQDSSTAGTPLKRSNSLPTSKVSNVEKQKLRQQLQQEEREQQQNGSTKSRETTPSSDGGSDDSSHSMNGQPALSSSPETDLSSGPSTPTLSSAAQEKAAGIGSTLVPQYPYNVQMTSHLNGPTPDDSEISSRLPSICVDYLSHDWSEDDVWTSWKAMTRHKAEIANGVRLENASWRTWAKQRGNLKTISPETLNWLKDSDVTWLYGPLHTAVDAVPPPKVATASDRLGLVALKPLKDSPKSKSLPLPPVSSSAAATSQSAAPAAVTGAATSPTGDNAREKENDMLSPEERSKERRRSLKPSKSILKHRSLSELLLNQPPVASPAYDNSNSLEYFNVDSTSIPHARSDSNLSRQGSLRRNRKASASSPRETSPDPAHMSDSSSSQHGAKSTRHISFNHRVEQCIALDHATDDAAPPYRYSSSSVGAFGGASPLDDMDEDDDEDVLTFKSSPKAPANGSGSPNDPSSSEPAIIARLGPTTLKGTEAYPSPSPAIIYPDYPTMNSSEGDMPRSVYGPPRSSYSTDGVVNSSSTDVDTLDDEDGDNEDLSATPKAGTPNVSTPDLTGQRSGPAAATSNNTNRSSGAGWADGEDEVEDYSMGFEYFPHGGPDVGVSDEYDMAQYGSQHLVPGTHNNYGAGSSTSASYTNTYSGETSPLPSPYDRPSGSSSASSSSTESSPSQSRLSSSSPLSQSPGRGPYSPSFSRDQPKRGILKPRSREPSSGASSVTGAVDIEPASSTIRTARFGGAINVSGSPTSPQNYSPASGSPVGSPRSSNSSLSAAMAQAGVPIRSAGGSSLRRNGSYDSDYLRGSGETRGRSTSRGSSSSLERSGSSDRRMSSSPNAYTSFIGGGGSSSGSGGGASSSGSSGSRPIGTSSSSSFGSGSRRWGSSDSLNAASAAVSASSGLPGVPEASSESEADTIKALPADDVELKRREREKEEEEISLVEDVEDSRRLMGSKDFRTNIKATVSDEEVASSSSSSSSSSAAVKSMPPAVAGAPNPDPSLPTAPPVIAMPAKPRNASAPAFASDDASRSLSNSPNLDPIDLASAHWSDETPVPSYARRSLLRAAARGNVLDRDDSIGRNSMDSGRTSSSGPDDYGYDYYDPVDDDRDLGISGHAARRAFGHYRSASHSADGSSNAAFGSSPSSTASHLTSSGSGSGGGGGSNADGSGLVGRTLEVAGTARDLIGAITKGLWNMGRRSASAPTSSVSTATATASMATRSRDDSEAAGSLNLTSTPMHKRAKSS